MGVENDISMWYLSWMQLKMTESVSIALQKGCLQVKMWMKKLAICMNTSADKYVRNEWLMQLFSAIKLHNIILVGKLANVFCVCIMVDEEI